jgi:hypothetical protein
LEGGAGARVRTCRSFFEIPVAGGGEQGGASDGGGEEARICDGVQGVCDRQRGLRHARRSVICLRDGSRLAPSA